MGIVGGDIASHVSHAMAFGTALAGRADRKPLEAFGAAFCVDLGSGAGLPALPLALLLPETEWLLIEVRGTRVTFLEGAVRRLGLTDRVEIWPNVVQEAAHRPIWRQRAMVVTARSFGSPGVTAECATGFLQVGGRLIVSEPFGEDSSARWPTAPLRKLGFGEPEPVAVGDHLFVVLEKVVEQPVALPRRRPAMERKPAF